MYLMDSRAERVYAEGRLFGPAGKGDSGYPDGLTGTIAWRSGAVSTSDLQRSDDHLGGH